MIDPSDLSDLRTVAFAATKLTAAIEKTCRIKEARAAVNLASMLRRAVDELIAADLIARGVSERERLLRELRESEAK